MSGTDPTSLPSVAGLLEGHKAIVTGGGGGIGRAIALRLHEAGAAIAVLDIDADAAAATAELVQGSAFTVNVAKSELLATAIVDADAALGGATILVNNAGVGNLKPLDQYTDKEYDLLMDVNLRAVFGATRALAPSLRERGTGTIVNVASASGLLPTRGESPYCAAKAGALAFTKSSALEYGPEVRVNAVAPGFIHTGLTEFAATDDRLRSDLESRTPLGRIGTADDVADVVVFLCSPLARYITGQTLVVDGGSLLINAQVDPMLSSFLD